MKTENFRTWNSALGLFILPFAFLKTATINAVTDLQSTAYKGTKRLLNDFPSTIPIWFETYPIAQKLIP